MASSPPAFTLPSLFVGVVQMVSVLPYEGMSQAKLLMLVLPSTFKVLWLAKIHCCCEAKGAQNVISKQLMQNPMIILFDCEVKKKELNVFTQLLKKIINENLLDNCIKLEAYNCLNNDAVEFSSTSDISSSETVVFLIYIFAFQ